MHRMFHIEHTQTQTTDTWVCALTHTYTHGWGQKQSDCHRAFVLFMEMFPPPVVISPSGTNQRWVAFTTTFAHLITVWGSNGSGVAPILLVLELARITEAVCFVCL